MSVEVPLFPLNTVLLPGMALALHIFEPRYREMVARCLEEGTPFGVALIRQGEEVGEHAEPYDVGTLARIASADRLDDGRYDIAIVGGSRFRILGRDTASRAYQVVEVEILADPEGPAPDDPLVVAVSQLFGDFSRLTLALVEQWSRRAPMPEEPTALSYHVAARLSVDPRERQRLLEASDARDRLERIRGQLEREVRVLRAQVELYFLQKHQGFAAGN